MAKTPHLDTAIPSLGETVYSSPLPLPEYTSDDDRALLNINKDYVEALRNGTVEPVYVELAGPRQKLFFDPRSTRAAIVTCGGLCPGLNDVIRAIVLTLYYTYGCRDILGIRYGFEGLNAAYNHTPLQLDPERVNRIHEIGGTILGSSRGAQDIGVMVDYLENNGIDILFTIGGDGTLRAANLIADEISRRGLQRSVIGVPKTIDNDINHVAKSFGFESAFTAAADAIRTAHVEAHGARNCVGLVKVMGRHSGFIAANATLANRDVNFCLIPEVDFDLEGERGLLNQLRKRLAKRGHAVIVVAEGAGQKFFTDETLGRDKSGNKQLGDIGIFLKQRIKEYFSGIEMELNIKYIDPSYIIRSVPATANDSVFCGFLGQMAAHAGMAGKHNMMVAVWNNMFTHLPLTAAIDQRKTVDPDKKLWLSVMETTGQSFLLNS